MHIFDIENILYFLNIYVYNLPTTNSMYEYIIFKINCVIF